VIKIAVPETSNFFPDPTGISVVLQTSTGADAFSAGASDSLAPGSTFAGGAQAAKAVTAHTPTAEAMTARRETITVCPSELPA
jgi:hypothetical protein